MRGTKLSRVGAVLALFVGVLAVPILSSRAADPSVTYTFEDCDDGFTIAETATEPVGGRWERSAPGNPTSSMAFRILAYPQAASPDNPERESYETTLTSPSHNVSGPASIKYFLFYNVETEVENQGGDYVIAEVSIDGGKNWTSPAGHKFSGVSTGFEEHEITGLQLGSDAKLRFRIRLYSDNLISGEGGSQGQIAVDDITISANRPKAAACGGEPGPEPSPSPTAGACTKSGNGKANTIKGTNGPDILCGKGGKDVLKGLKGNDRLKGGPGPDLLNGGPGSKDTCIGGDGKDTFKNCETKKQ
jgi:hypothetical protein